MEEIDRQTAAKGRELMARLGGKVGAPVDFRSVPHPVLHLDMSRGRTGIESQLLSLESFIIDPKNYSDDEKAFVDWVKGAARLFGIQNIVLLNSHFLGGATFDDSTSTMYINQRIVSTRGRPFPKVGGLDEATYMIVYFLAHIIQDQILRIKEVDPLILEIEAEANPQMAALRVYSVIEDVTASRLTNDSRGEFAACMRHVAGVLLFHKVIKLDKSTPSPVPVLSSGSDKIGSAPVIPSGGGWGSKVKGPNRGDNAMTANAQDLGGIDLDPNHSVMEIQGENIPFDFEDDWAQLTNTSFEGFEPILLTITPVVNIQSVLGI